MTSPAITGSTRKISMGAFTFAFWATYDDNVVIKSCTAPNGMFSKDVMYLSNPRPLRIRGSNVFVTDALTFSTDIVIYSYVLAFIKTFHTLGHSNL
jgi:hypothetical protein